MKPVFAAMLGLCVAGAAMAQDTRPVTLQIAPDSGAVTAGTLVMVEAVDDTGARHALRAEIAADAASVTIEMSVTTGLVSLRGALRAPDNALAVTPVVPLAPGADAQALGSVTAQATMPMGFVSLIRCDGAEMELGFAPDAVLSTAGGRIPLTEAELGSGTRHVSQDGQTEIRTKGDQVMLRLNGQDLTGCAMVPADQDLRGAAWRITEIAGTPAQGAPEILFDPAGRVGGSTGCNRFMGGYTLRGGLLSLGQLAGTRMACPGDLMAQEQAVFAALSRIDGYAVGPDGLVLTALGVPVLRAQR